LRNYFRLKTSVLVHPVRLACTGNPSGPSLYHLLEVLGKERALARIERAFTNFDCRGESKSGDAT